jgi:acyl-CoA thioesterase I
MLRHVDIEAIGIERCETLRLCDARRLAQPIPALVLVLAGALLACPGARLSAALLRCEAASDLGPAASPPASAAADWPMRQFYRDANAQLLPPRGSVPRVVFIGDSITASWRLTAVAPRGTELINRGIGGQVTLQMLLRFSQDVIALRPAAVHIMAGINDIAENAGPTTLAAIERNLASMAELARAHQVRVVLASVSPAYDFPWRRGLQPAPKIAALNRWLREYAQRCDTEYVDYHEALADTRGGVRSGLSEDGVHPNAAGYAVMQSLARRAIERTLGRPAK